MALSAVCVILTLFGSVAGQTDIQTAIAQPELLEKKAEETTITYNGSKAEANWSMEYGIEYQMQSRIMKADISHNTIPVFVFSRLNGHMETMVLDWGRLHVYNVSVAMRGGSDDWKGMSKAFQMIEDTRPPIAVWLLGWKAGQADSLDNLGEAFQRTQQFTRHIVFHWSPEFCDQGTATFQRIKTAFEHVDTVFQFAYQDERLAALDKDKFKPWPLGAAYWRGWETPSSQLAIESRENLVCFRGSINTHPELTALQGGFSGHDDVIIEDSGEWSQQVSDFDLKRYKTLLATSKYGMNVAGNNPNCYRIFEIIESGAIPVIVAKKGLHQCYDNWAAVYGHPTGTQYDWIPQAPFEVLESWDELPHRLEEMSSLATVRGSALKTWYEQWRQSFTEAFASAIHGRESNQEKVGKATFDTTRFQLCMSSKYPRIDEQLDRRCMCQLIAAQETVTGCEKETATVLQTGTV